MIARAPGKVVLAGAYAVLDGAPALVAAVDRYVVADAGREATLVTPEVREALAGRGSTGAPWFDARALRDEANDRKLGLGSSAAILVASLAALELATEPGLDDAALAKRVFEAALSAHRIAQGGGSGIDVAASAFGRILRFQLPQEGGSMPHLAVVELPKPLYVDVWASTSAASTSAMLGGVAAFRDARPDAYRAVMNRLAAAAVNAVQAGDGARFVDACRQQTACLIELGDLAQVPIVTSEVEAMGRIAQAFGAAALPSGAGGGDVVLLVGTERMSVELADIARHHGFVPLHLSLGARGVHASPPSLLADPQSETWP